jgi:hypothetical protein
LGVAPLDSQGCAFLIAPFVVAPVAFLLWLLRKRVFFIHCFIAVPVWLVLWMCCGITQGSLMASINGAMGKANYPPFDNMRERMPYRQSTYHAK